MAIVRNNSIKMKKIRNAIKDMYSTCFFCGEFVKREDRTIDHFESLSKGGTDSPENMVVSCLQCNTEKSDLDVEEYIKLKLEGFDFKARAERNKIKRGFGFEGAIYEQMIVPMSSIKSYPKTPPNREKIDKRKQYYNETGCFKKPSYVRKQGNKYIILQGFINYIILKELNIKEMPVIVVSKPENDNTHQNKK